jgi:hypothetical protein
VKIRFFLFCFPFLFSLHVFALESETHYWYTHGYYTKSIHALRTELKTSNSPEKKSRLYYDIAYSYYAMSFVEDFKKYVDSAYYFAKRKEKFTYFDVVDYGISMMRFNNYQIKPTISLGYYHRIFHLLHKNDPLRKDKRWIQLYQTLATTRRNYGSDYTVMNAYYDSAFFLLKKHKMVGAINEINYCRSRGNMNLDRVGLKKSDSTYYKEAINYFTRALELLNKEGNENYPSIITFQCLSGLVSYMRGEYYVSKYYFDQAFKTLESAKNKGYAVQDLQSIYLNVVNWSSFTVSILYQQTKNSSLIIDQLKKLKRCTRDYHTYTNFNQDVDLSIFTDIYGYSPYNSIISCYYYLFDQSKNKAYLDTAFYYGEINKTQWFSKELSYQQFLSTSNHFVSKGNTIIQYGEFGFLHHKSLYAFVKTSRGLHFKILGIRDKIVSDQSYSNSLSLNAFRKKSNYLYQKVFKPLESFIPLTTKRILLSKSSFLDSINLESLVYDTTKRNLLAGFLISKYPIFEQPSFRVFNSNKTEIIQTCSYLQPNYSSKNKATIHFTSDLFSKWLQDKSIILKPFKNSSHDLNLIAAHGYSQNHRVAGAYLDLGYQKLTIKNICANKQKCKLTLLASCDGGLGQRIGTGSSFSLASAFLYSGSKSCVYSMWKLDDKVASEILTIFLRRLELGEPKDWALRNAKLEYLQNVTSEEGYNPIYWAGLQVMGDVSPVTIGSHTNDWIWVALLILLISMGVIFMQFHNRKRKIV